MNQVREIEYTVIKSKEQYYNYCNKLEKLLEDNNADYIDHVELLTVLIEKWDQEHDTFQDLDPIQLLKSLMNDHDLKAVHIAKILGLTTGTVSKIMNYKKGLSKESIKKLSDYFKVRQEAFNRPYNLNKEPSSQIIYINPESIKMAHVPTSVAECQVQVIRSRKKN
ncbi:MAG: helix-turn-helix domain-containing protein [Candidatus Cyclobacteriaceae bacterium M2_1C_046]